MKKITALASLVILLSFFGFQTNECPTIPALNKKIFAYMQPKIGKNVGDVCSDFIEGGYTVAGLNYYGMHDSERKIDFTKECVYPGDIIVLGGGLELSWKRNDTAFSMTYDKDREFFIYKVKSKGVYSIARTETVNNKHKVVLTAVDLTNTKKGKPRIYRLEKE